LNAPANATPPAAPPAVSPRAFLLRFALAFAVLEALVYGLLWRDGWFAPYARWNAAGTAWLFGPFVEGLRATESYLMMPAGSVVVKPGCDAYQASAVLLAGIVAFPAHARQRVVGAVAGVAILSLLNLVRLGAILLVLVHRPELFDRMHVEILPGLFVLAALALWLGWILWVRPRPA
jgi:exosortase/archaeosortase family protein